MASAFGNRALFDDKYLVSLPYGAQTVCNNERCPSFHQVCETLLDEGFTLCIKIRRCLIEDQNPRVRKNSPGYSDPLSLTS